MSMRDGCDKILLLQAEFDGELDAVQSLSMTQHRESCAVCRDAWQRLQSTRRVLREKASYYPASADLMARLDAALPRLATVSVASPVPTPMTHPAAPSVVATAPGSRRIPGRTSDRDSRGTSRWTPHRWWQPAAGFGFGAAAAAALALLLMTPPRTVDLADLVVASHVRSMQAGHLLDVASNDQHNVKPWFDGRVDFAPPVKNLADRGFPLVGGRLDYLEDRNVAALVYRAGPHIINMLIWPSPRSMDMVPQPVEKGGYNIIRWQERGMNIWAVSDLNATELRDFVTAWRAHD
jgi:anti-sigma factor RsiW